VAGNGLQFFSGDGGPAKSASLFFCGAAPHHGGRNPIPIVIPCHRVIAAGRKLGGFGGGLPTKVKLLGLKAGKAGAV
jgi:hypothetical protein